MKKINFKIINCLTVVLVFVFFVLYTMGSRSNRDRVVGIVELTYDQVKQKMRSENFILYIGREDCQDCQVFNVFLKEYIIENPQRGLYYLDLQKIRRNSLKENANNEDIALYDEVKSVLHIDWVPTVLFINKHQLNAEYKFLNEKYYEINDTVIQEQFIKKYKEKFIEWMDERY